MPPVLARILSIAAVLILSLPHGALAADEVSCEAAGAEAERAWQLPPGLLAAIGRTESGRYDPATGKVAAWPWTINAAGVGRYFDGSATAVAAVRDLQMQGVRLIDVGCFQIDLFYHPDAFTTLEDAFDARNNANYAARFLSELYGRTGSWEAAVADYHSAVPEEGGPYRTRVMADWQGGGLGSQPRCRRCARRMPPPTRWRCSSLPPRSGCTCSRRWLCPPARPSRWRPHRRPIRSPRSVAAARRHVCHVSSRLTAEPPSYCSNLTST